jgi:hypothetical protein
MNGISSFLKAMKPNFESINAICPIYTASDRERPNLIGTGTLLDFAKARFLVTAAHVHDEYTENQVALYIATAGSLIELPQPFHTTVVPPSRKREDDRLDFAFVRLTDEIADEIAKGRFFLPFSLIDANDHLKPRARYMFTGFPGSREKTSYGDKKVKPQRFSFTGETVSPKRMLALGIEPATHIAVEFDRERAFDEAGQPACFPRVKGMSGGAVWRGDGDSHLWLTEVPVRLVGIGIEDPKNQNVLVAVRIHLVLAAIARIHPDIQEFVPQRAGFASNITVNERLS